MSFKSVDEIEQFRFDDCQISRFAAMDQAVELEKEEAEAFPKKCVGAYLYEMKRTPTGYVLAIEFEDEEERAMGNSYQVSVCCESVVCTWERYMNRVQK